MNFLFENNSTDSMLANDDSLESSTETFGPKVIKSMSEITGPCDYHLRTILQLFIFSVIVLCCPVLGLLHPYMGKWRMRNNRRTGITDAEAERLAIESWENAKTRRRSEIFSADGQVNDRPRPLPGYSTSSTSLIVSPTSPDNFWKEFSQN